MNEASNDCEDSSHRKNIVEVGYNVVGIMKDNVQRGVSKNNPCQASYRKQEDKTESSEYRGVSFYCASVKGGQSAKDFYACWDGNDYSGGCEVGPGVYVHSYCKHVVGSNNKP